AVEQLRPDVPPGVAAVLTRMLAKKPEDRYQTPSQVAEALAPLCASLPGPSYFRRLGLKWPGIGIASLAKHRRLVGVGAGILLASLAVALFFLLTPTPASAGLKNLRTQSKNAKTDIDGSWLRRDIIEFRMKYPGTSEAREAAEMLMRLPSPLDQLDPNNIPPEKRPPRPP